MITYVVNTVGYVIFLTDLNFTFSIRLKNVLLRRFNGM